MGSAVGGVSSGGVPSYLAIVKNGGGTGTIFLNGYFQGWYPSQVTEVTSGNYTITTNHGNLNF